MEANKIITTYGTAGKPFCKCDICKQECICTSYKINKKFSVHRAYCNDCLSKHIIGRYEVERGIFEGLIFFGYEHNNRIINIKTVGQSYPKLNCKRLNSIIGKL